MSKGDEIQKVLRQYVSAEKRLHELFGYEQQWRVFPIEDQTKDYWMDLSDATGGTIAWAHKPWDDALIVAGDDHYSGTIYTQRHLKKWVYRTTTHTMALVDTQCDFNVILMVFDNARECTDARLKALYREHW